MATDCTPNIESTLQAPKEQKAGPLHGESVINQGMAVGKDAEMDRIATQTSHLSEERDVDSIHVTAVNTNLVYPTEPESPSSGLSELDWKGTRSIAIMDSVIPTGEHPGFEAPKDSISERRPWRTTWIRFGPLSGMFAM